MTPIFYCANCKNFHEKDYEDREANPHYTCKAFLNRIPDVIVFGDFVHTKPYKGDNGLLYDEDVKKTSWKLTQEELIAEIEKFD